MRRLKISQGPKPFDCPVCALAVAGRRPLFRPQRPTCFRQTSATAAINPPMTRATGRLFRGTPHEPRNATPDRQSNGPWAPLRFFFVGNGSSAPRKITLPLHRLHPACEITACSGGRIVGSGKAAEFNMPPSASAAPFPTPENASALGPGRARRGLRCAGDRTRSREEIGRAGVYVPPENPDLPSVVRLAYPCWPLSRGGGGGGGFGPCSDNHNLAHRASSRGGEGGVGGSVPGPPYRDASGGGVARPSTGGGYRGGEGRGGENDFPSRFLPAGKAEGCSGGFSF